MICPACSNEYEAANQHSACPECKRKVGTDKDKENEETLTRVISWFEDWETATEEARRDSERDRDYYDGIQWKADELADLKDRNQPPTVKNRIAKKINFLLGQEIRNRTDPRAMPRTQMHDEDVKAVTDALRYVCDAEDFDAIGSACWFDRVTGGYCGAVVEHEIGPDKRIDIKIRQVEWDRLWYDLHSRKRDFSDAKHFGISTWWDVDDAIDFYAERKDAADNATDVIEAGFDAAGSSPTDETHEDRPRGQWVNKQGNRRRVRISECYYRKGKVWYVCHYTKSGFVVPPKPTGYKDENGNDICPLELSGAFTTRDGNRYGLIRNMIGPQDEINKRSSKALHWMTVDRVTAEDGAVRDPDGAQTERAKPDGWVTVERGALTDGRIVFEKGADMAAGQVQLLAEAKMEIDSIGPEAPQIGDSPSATSGRALMVRQQMGSLELAPIEDLQKKWKKAIYTQIWYRIRQFWTDEMWLRVTDDADSAGYRFVGINQKTTRAERFLDLIKKGGTVDATLESIMGKQAPIVMQQAQAMHQQMAQRNPQLQQMDPEQQKQHMAQMLSRHPFMQEPIVAGDVAKINVDIVLDESPDVSVLQQEEYEKLVELIPSFLQNGMDGKMLLKMALEASQLRGKKRLLAELNKPADPQQQQMQQAMQKAQQDQAQANVQKTQTESSLNQARTAKEAATAQSLGAEAQLAVPKAQAEIEAKQAKAMNDAANAGAQAGGGGAF